MKQIKTKQNKTKQNKNRTARGMHFSEALFLERWFLVIIGNLEGRAVTERRDAWEKSLGRIEGKE